MSIYCCFKTVSNPEGGEGEGEVRKRDVGGREEGNSVERYDEKRGRAIEHD